MLPFPLPNTRPSDCQHYTLIDYKNIGQLSDSCLSAFDQTCQAVKFCLAAPDVTAAAENAEKTSAVAAALVVRKTVRELVSSVAMHA